MPVLRRRPAQDQLGCNRDEVDLQSVPGRRTGRNRRSSLDSGIASSALGSTAAVICTGVKHGPTFSTVRAWRRQVNTTLAATQLRRATSVTLAPGTSVSSTIRALSSCDQRRRRSNPSNTSTRIACQKTVFVGTVPCSPDNER